MHRALPGRPPAPMATSSASSATTASRAGRHAMSAMMAEIERPLLLATHRRAPCNGFTAGARGGSMAEPDRAARGRCCDRAKARRRAPSRTRETCPSVSSTSDSTRHGTGQPHPPWARAHCSTFSLALWGLVGAVLGENVESPHFMGENSPDFWYISGADGVRAGFPAHCGVTAAKRGSCTAAMPLSGTIISILATSLAGSAWNALRRQAHGASRTQ